MVKATKIRTKQDPRIEASPSPRRNELSKEDERDGTIVN